MIRDQLKSHSTAVAFFMKSGNVCENASFHEICDYRPNLGTFVKTFKLYHTLPCNAYQTSAHSSTV